MPFDLARKRNTEPLIERVYPVLFWKSTHLFISGIHAFGYMQDC